MNPFESKESGVVRTDISAFESRGVVAVLVVHQFESRGAGAVAEFVSAGPPVISLEVTIGTPVVSIATATVVAGQIQINGAVNMPIFLDNDNHILLPAVKDRLGVFFTTGADVTVALEDVLGGVVISAKTMTFVVGSNGDFEHTYDKADLPSSGGSAIKEETHLLRFIGSEGGKDFERFDAVFVKRQKV